MSLIRLKIHPSTPAASDRLSMRCDTIVYQYKVGCGLDHFKILNIIHSGTVLID